MSPRSVSQHGLLWVEQGTLNMTSSLHCNNTNMISSLHCNNTNIIIVKITI